ncbi:MAG TPA: cell division protein ZipA C-terminal FtsZ-binding domain-containing protein [Steroidobacter sp.]|nr:cell division protein ZipA C-terminal FtsZ-binding domain-containing protein [Steroidobacter sp.]
MNDLRWILIGFGIILLALIYLTGRRGARTGASEDAPIRRRPSFSGSPAADATLDPTAYAHEEPTHEPDAPSVPDEAQVPNSLRSIDFPEPSGGSARRGGAAREARPGRMEPTVADDAPTKEPPLRAQPAAPAPTLSSSEAPQARRPERRKILALRLAAAAEAFNGGVLLEAFQAESLHHGKYQIFHRLHEDGAGILFSIASMVEPGAFDPEKMPTMQFPGITLFALLPGPAPGMHALNELVACARKLQQALGGAVQDDRGVPLTVHRIERLRQEVREFERPPGAGPRSGASSGV